MDCDIRARNNLLGKCLLVTRYGIDSDTVGIFFQSTLRKTSTEDILNMDASGMTTMICIIATMVFQFVYSILFLNREYPDNIL